MLSFLGLSGLGVNCQAPLSREKTHLACDKGYTPTTRGVNGFSFDER